MPNTQRSLLAAFLVVSALCHPALSSPIAPPRLPSPPFPPHFPSRVKRVGPSPLPPTNPNNPNPPTPADPNSCIYSCHDADTANHPAINSLIVPGTTNLQCTYETIPVGICDYSTVTGALTNDRDSGDCQLTAVGSAACPAQGTCTYTCPATDTAGMNPVATTDANGELLCTYSDATRCVYDPATGGLISDQDAGGCANNAVASAACPATACTYSCPLQDGNPFANSAGSISGAVLTCAYDTASDTCEYDTATGARTADNDSGECPATAVANSAACT